MNRKHFLGKSALALASAALPISRLMAAPGKTAPAWTIPPYLKKGDVIGITCPSGYIPEKDIQPAVQQLTAWGFTVETGKTVGLRDGSFGGSDAERLADFQQMIDSPHIKAVLCARGGYGFVRIIDQVDFTRFRRHPKWIIGFSDITVLHCHLAHNYHIASLHSKMTNSFPENAALADAVQQQTIQSIYQALSGEKMQYSAVMNPNNRTGKASGILVGGNLNTIETLAGSASDLPTAGKILFIEDTHEYLYSIDRMLWNLKRSRKLQHLKGLIVGGFSLKPDEPGDEFGRTLYDIVMEKVKQYSYPVCFDFPVGHQKNNMALKCGVRHQLIVHEAGATLTELR
ncbi:LD-carboxypeptidase [Deminuibacter soli]|uniref:LD-carboxypeptidase n=2 Tax=Deminuibacter soli TaxID=2291815 RepID=A0A3E1NS39_9BACT|nr:LD-carboxypeptidase [Deminuibacter soli]